MIKVQLPENDKADFIRWMHSRGYSPEEIARAMPGLQSDKSVHMALYWGRKNKNGKKK